MSQITVDNLFTNFIYAKGSLLEIFVLIKIFRSINMYIMVMEAIIHIIAPIQQIILVVYLQHSL